jgi:hypothetical protein
MLLTKATRKIAKYTAMMIVQNDIDRGLKFLSASSYSLTVLATSALSSLTGSSELFLEGAIYSKSKPEQNLPQSHDKEYRQAR